MKRFGRKLLSVLIAAAVFTSGIFLGASPAYAAEWDGILAYQVNADGNIAITRCSSIAAGTVTIPSEIDGKSVTEIFGGAFMNCSGVTEIIVPDTVYEIGMNAFWGTAWYNSLPDGPVYVGKVLYSYNGTMPEDTVITLTEGTVTVSDSIFESCENLTGVVFANSVRTIGYSSFADCVSLTEISLPSSLESIEESAFSGCTSLENVTVNSDVSFVGANAFLDTPWVMGQPDGPLYIGKTLYRYCGEMPDEASITVADGTVSITDGAFQFYDTLSAINIPASVTSIGSMIFLGCMLLSAITVDSDNEAYASRDGVLFEKGMKTLLVYPVGLENSVYAIPDGVTTVEIAAFYLALNLTEVVIPESLTTVSSGSFALCTGLTSVTVPSDVMLIEEAAFLQCSSLTEVTVLGNETEIRGSAFDGCSSELVVHGYSGSAAEAFAEETEGTVQFIAFNELASQTLNASGAYITGLPELSTLNELASGLSCSDGNTIGYSINGAGVTDMDTFAGTGTVITVRNTANEQVDYRTLVIPGDVSGDSAVDSLDLITVDLALNNHTELRGAYRAAALEVYSLTGEISVSDYQYVEGIALS